MGNKQSHLQVVMSKLTWTVSIYKSEIIRARIVGHEVVLIDRLLRCSDRHEVYKPYKILSFAGHRYFVVFKHLNVSNFQLAQSSTIGISVKCS
jgi:hypothetical protein